MGQATSMFPGKVGFEAQVRKIADQIYDRFVAKYGKDHLTMDELYILILMVFNDINRLLPGPHCDPPPREEVEAFDQDRNGIITKEEFAKFVEHFGANLVNKFSKTKIVTAVAAPAILTPVTKKTAEKVPGLEKIVPVIPDTVIASVLTVIMLTIPNVFLGKIKI